MLRLLFDNCYNEKQLQLENTDSAGDTERVSRRWSRATELYPGIWVNYSPLNRTLETWNVPPDGVKNQFPSEIKWRIVIKPIHYRPANAIDPRLFTLVNIVQPWLCGCNLAGLLAFHRSVRSLYIHIYCISTDRSCRVL